MQILMSKLDCFAPMPGGGERGGGGLGGVAYRGRQCGHHRAEIVALGLVLGERPRLLATLEVDLA